MYRKSRYDKGEPSTSSGQGDDYLNIPLDRDAYAQLVARSANARTPPGQRTSRRRATSKVVCRSKRWPIAAMTCCVSGRSSRSACAIREPADAVRRRAASQRESPGHRIQSRRLSDAPDLARATRSLREASRTCSTPSGCALGVMHRNTFIDSPRLLDSQLKLRGSERSTLPVKSPARKATSKLPHAAR